MSSQLMTPEARLAYFRELAINVPNISRAPNAPAPSQPDTLKWIGRLTALIEQQGNVSDIATLRVAISQLGTMSQGQAIGTIIQSLYTGLAKAELGSNPGFQGVFVPVGNSFDAFAAVSQIMSNAAKEIMIVDAYLDASVMTKFIIAAPEGVSVHLLSDEKTVYADLAPAVAAFRTQYGNDRPIEARVTLPRALHDRLIIVDGAKVWDLSQSLKDFANRSPGGITIADSEIASRKSSHYLGAWQSASALA